MFSVQILVGSEPGLPACLASLERLGKFELIVGDLGLSPEYRGLLGTLDARIVRVEPRDMSLVRNQLAGLASCPGKIYLEPWETVEAYDGDGNAFRVFRGDLVTQEVRIWTDEEFVGPVHESLDATPRGLAGTIFSGSGRKTLELRLADAWVKARPLDALPYYHRALANLALGQYDPFWKDSEVFLFRVKPGERPGGVEAIRYHRAQMCCYRLEDHRLALEELGGCLLASPLRAEYWCLLGDIYYFLLKQYQLASEFYTNALVLGSRRSDDGQPIEIGKYGEYPEEMLVSCQRLLGSVSLPSRRPSA